NDFFVSADGANWMAQGDLNGATTGDDVLVYNNSVVIQEDSTLSGFASPVSAITESIMETNGDWYARGSNDDGQDWLLRNGALIAKTGDAIPGGLPGETISDALFGSAFFTMGGNNNGDVFWGATTSNLDPEADAVIVVNDMVILRQGDAVDLDGNGLLDDGVFVDIFNNDDGFLTDDLKYYFTADLVDANGSSLGQAFLRIEVPAPGALALFGLAGLAGCRRRRSA
ncbi:MAG: PEP-CTERM sorting domain-containing protein, partial [Planctomycetota bacterium]|nr:PEP-CTERM sorting domain-containing protein [Planctomycetota bacterium]